MITEVEGEAVRVVDVEVGDLHHETSVRSNIPQMTNVFRKSHSRLSRNTLDDGRDDLSGICSYFLINYEMRF